MDVNKIQEFVTGIGNTLHASGMKSAVVVVVQYGDKTLRAVVLNDINAIVAADQIAMATSDVLTGRIIQAKPPFPSSNDQPPPASHS